MNSGSGKGDTFLGARNVTAKKCKSKYEGRGKGHCSISHFLPQPTINSANQILTLANLCLSFGSSQVSLGGIVLPSYKCNNYLHMRA